jgi:hypothetical protein
LMRAARDPPVRASTISQHSSDTTAMASRVRAITIGRALGQAIKSIYTTRRLPDYNWV